MEVEKQGSIWARDQVFLPDPFEPNFIQEGLTRPYCSLGHLIFGKQDWALLKMSMPACDMSVGGGGGDICQNKGSGMLGPLDKMFATTGGMYKSTTSGIQDPLTQMFASRGKDLLIYL